ncbi:hypothetical protein XENOCAPTIV_012907, partial [Xenoophorus captivus]
PPCCFYCSCLGRKKKHSSSRGNLLSPVSIPTVSRIRYQPRLSPSCPGGAAGRLVLYKCRQSSDAPGAPALRLSFLNLKSSKGASLFISSISEVARQLGILNHPGGKRDNGGDVNVVYSVFDVYRSREVCIDAAFSAEMKVNPLRLDNQV